MYTFNSKIIFSYLNHLNGTIFTFLQFEALTGIIDDCCCNVQTVDNSLYNEKMHHMLSDLVVCIPLTPPRPLFILLLLLYSLSPFIA